jgi:hypothetical protein
VGLGLGEVRGVVLKIWLVFLVWNAVLQLPCLFRKGQWNSKPKMDGVAGWVTLTADYTKTF